MSKYETTLRQIIYHYSQQTLPIQKAFENKKVYAMPSGKEITFAPITAAQDVSLEERMEVCKDILVPSSLGFYDEAMRTDYYEIFCVENLMREIEYETVSYFLAKWKTNIRKCVYKYNQLYKIISADVNLLTDYERNIEETTDDDIKHGKQIDGNGKDTLTHGLVTSTENSSENENKTVFEDTPENELLNTNYATNITKTGGESSGTSTTTNSGNDINQMVNQTKESGKTERDLHRILTEYGRNKSFAELISEVMNVRMNIIEDMVEETAKGLFIKVW